MGFRIPKYAALLVSMVVLSGAAWSSGCALEEGVPAEGALPGGEAIVEASYVTGPGGQARLWATFHPAEGGGELYLFDFTRRRVSKLVERQPSFAEAIAKLGTRVELEAIEDPRLRRAVASLERSEGALRELQPGDYVPRFELREREVGVAAEALIRQDSEDTCELEAAAFSDRAPVLVVVDARGELAGAGEELSAVSRRDDGRLCRRRGHGDAARYAACRDECLAAGIEADHLCQDAYNHAIAAIELAEDLCKSGCDDHRGYPCAGVVRAACRASCATVAGLAEASAAAALAGCSLGVGAASGTCMSACRDDYLGRAYSGSPHCGALE